MVPYTSLHMYGILIAASDIKIFLHHLDKFKLNTHTDGNLIQTLLHGIIAQYK